MSQLWSCFTHLLCIQIIWAVFRCPKNSIETPVPQSYHIFSMYFIDLVSWFVIETLFQAHDSFVIKFSNYLRTTLNTNPD